jgi:sulfate permease, SulP family
MTRYLETINLLPLLKLKPGYALREKFKEGYTASDLRMDLMAGIVVAMVAIPLGMALAIASGVAPHNGLYTVIIAGGVVALLGGSRCQVTGPTAAFVVVLAPIATKFGFGGLMIAGLMAGVLLILMGLARLGRLIEFIPYPVTTGFTAGIAVVIATIQLKDFLGLTVEQMPESYLERLAALIQALPTLSYREFSVGLFTLALLLFWPRFNKKIPAPLVALSFVTLGTLVAKNFWPDFQVTTIGSRFNGIPQKLPEFVLPWNLSDAKGQPLLLDFPTLRALFPSAFAIAMLGGIESLLSAVVADGMAGTKHDPDSELVALGVGNILCPFFGGVAATGAIARTATNIRFGAKSPIAAFIHAIFTLLVVLLFAPYVSYLPMAGLAALLLLVAYNMSETKHFIHIVKVSPRSDVIVLLLCFFLTVVFDMVVGVTVGVVLASLLFMKRMASLTRGRALVGEGRGEKLSQVPEDVIIYEIAGPLFFGAANRAVEALGDIKSEVKCVVFDMADVPAMDATGLVALESAARSLHSRDVKMVLAELQAQPKELIGKSGFLSQFGNVSIFDTLELALKSLKK